jgi:DNA-binding XRE family transcriptional regulator
MSTSNPWHAMAGTDGRAAATAGHRAQRHRPRTVSAQGTVPNDVVNVVFERGVSPMAAWREHLGLTQAAVAERIGITQAAYAQMERVKRPRKATLEKVAAALGLDAEQLRW